eukprot:4892453-Amphidinium_carterae.1
MPLALLACLPSCGAMSVWSQKTTSSPSYRDCTWWTFWFAILHLRACFNRLVWSLVEKCPFEVMLERRQYAPVGWTKKYEFSDADQICGRDIIDAWIDSVSNGAQFSLSCVYFQLQH